MKKKIKIGKIGIGVTVIIESGWLKYLGLVVGETKTCWRIKYSNTKSLFKKADFHLYGGCSYDSTVIKEIKDTDQYYSFINSIKLQNLRRSIRLNIEDQIDKMSLNDLKTIAFIINAYKDI